MSSLPPVTSAGNSHAHWVARPSEDQIDVSSIVNNTRLCTFERGMALIAAMIGVDSYNDIPVRDELASEMAEPIMRNDSETDRYVYIRYWKEDKYAYLSFTENVDWSWSIDDLNPPPLQTHLTLFSSPYRLSTDLRSSFYEYARWIKKSREDGVIR